MYKGNRYCRYKTGKLIATGEESNEMKLYNEQVRLYYITSFYL